MGTVMMFIVFPVIELSVHCNCSLIVKFATDGGLKKICYSLHCKMCILVAVLLFPCPSACSCVAQH